jgi:ABC-type transporter Mla subunit MlaD
VSKKGCQVIQAIPYEEFAKVLHAQYSAAADTGTFVSFTDSETLKSERADIVNNADLLRIVLQTYNDRKPPLEELITLFRQVDDAMNKTVSRATRLASQKVWAEGEAKKLRRHVSYLRLLARRAEHSAHEASTTQHFLPPRSSCMQQPCD